MALLLRLPYPVNPWAEYRPVVAPGAEAPTDCRGYRPDRSLPSGPDPARPWLGLLGGHGTRWKPGVTGRVALCPLGPGAVGVRDLHGLHAPRVCAHWFGRSWSPGAGAPGRSKDSVNREIDP